jgi:fermentation-respiration switch protein FrsA (DUF1100 family)
MPQNPSSIANRLMNILLAVIVAYVIVLLLLRTFESHFLFFPNSPSRLEGDWQPRTLPVQNVQLTAADGTKLHAWWIPNPNATFTFLAFHGNASNVPNRIPIYEFLHSLPANVLALDYRGYGRSEGSPSESGIYQDADAAYQYLTARQNIPPSTIVSYGQSLGTAVAANLASRKPVAAVILEAPFPSASAVARKAFWFFPGIQLLVHGQLDTAARLKQITAPVLIVHCTQDPVIPFNMGQATYAAANPPKQFLPIESYCHEEASIIAPDRYRPALPVFLSSLAPPIALPCKANLKITP